MHSQPPTSTQRVSAHSRGDLAELTLPGPARRVPGHDLLWGRAEEIGSPAYWAAQTWMWEIEEPEHFKLGRSLREETLACLLGGYGIPAETGLAAYARLRSAPPDELRSESAVRALLSAPLNVGGRNVHYRFARQKSRYVSAKLQACCLNFNHAIKELAGPQYGLDDALGLALQFRGVAREQRDTLLADTEIPASIQAAQTTFEDALTDEMIVNPRYSYRVAYIEQSVNSRGKADQVVEFIKPDSERGERLRLLLKEVEKPKMKPGQIVALMHEEGFPRFTMHDHTQLWKLEDAKAEGKAFGTTLPDGSWYWYSNWVDRVRAYVRANSERFN